MKYVFSFITVVIVLATSCKPPASSTKPVVTTETISASLKWSERMALSILKRNQWMLDTAGAGWGYTQGLIYYSFEQLGKATADKKYDKVISLYANQMIAPDGSIKGFKREEFNLDNINAGKILFKLL